MNRGCHVSKAESRHSYQSHSGYPINGKRQYYRQGGRLQAGADSYLTKPFSASLLQSRISNLLTLRRLLSERFAIRPDKPKKTKHGGKESHYHGIYEQVGQGIPR